MDQLLRVSLAFPTVILTILVGIALVYWVFVILGALDIDIFHADADGGGDIGDIGHAHGADAGADIGHAHGADAGDTGGHDGGDGGHDSDADIGDSGGIWAALGLGRVPITISVSLVVFFAWVACLVIMSYLDGIDGLPRWLLGTAVLVGALLLSIPPAALVARPLAPVFVIAAAKKRTDYIGSVCTVTTGRVGSSFGQARIEDGGDDLLIQVRCDKGNVFSRNAKALIIDYDEAREAYLIEAMDSVLGKQNDS